MGVHESLSMQPPNNEHAGGAELLSTRLSVEAWEEIEKSRWHSIPTTFIPHSQNVHARADYDIGDERVVEIRTGSDIRYGESERRFREKEVPMLNVLFTAEGALSLSGLAQRLNAHETRQIRAIRRVMGVANAPELGAFVKIDESGDEPTYQIDPDVALVDRRVPERDRRAIIQELSRAYADDTYVQKAVAALFKDESLFYSDFGYDSIKTISLGVEGEEQLNEILTECIERYKEGKSTPEEEREAVICFHKLVYSFLPYARYMILESAGRITSRRRTPLSGFLRRFFESNLSRPIDDALQLAAVGVVKAIQNYDSSKADLFPHVAMTVNYEVKDGILDIVRHIWGHTPTDIKENKGIPSRRSLAKTEEDYDIVTDVATLQSREEDHLEYEQLLSRIAARNAIMSALEDDSFEPIDKLILSLSTGVYLPEFEGYQFTSTQGRQFVYDQQLKHNPFFREGLSIAHIARILDATVGAVRTVRGAGLASLESILRQNASNQYYEEKWANTLPMVR